MRQFDVYPVIISGGAGTRLWPLSRPTRPKQFLTLTGTNNLLAETVLRTWGHPQFAPPTLVAGDDHRFLVAETIRDIEAEPLAILLEPEGRNTAPAIAAAAIHLLGVDPEALLLIQPSDHFILDTTSFIESIDAAREPANEGYLMTFGVKPDRPETGYGWIEPGAKLSPKTECRVVTRFHEKPDASTAEEFLETGRFRWNAGVFLARADRLVEELTATCPDIIEHVTEALGHANQDLDFLRLEPEAFRRNPNISIDKAVMERSGRVAMCDLGAEWTDVGGFDALYDLHPPDTSGNAMIGNVAAIDAVGCHVRNESGRLVSLVGVQDLTVVDTADALMIAPRGETGRLKDLVAHLSDTGAPEATSASRVHRPWGWYQIVDKGDHFLVKRITVNPGARLSLQLHRHRAEHWVVVKGTAKVTIGDAVSLLRENESTFIPTGQKHRLENPGPSALEMIEVQSGAYLSEDDIVRFADAYGRD